MSSSPSPLIKLELQASGEHNDTWGDNLNATLVLVENAVAKRAVVATTGGTTTLTDTQFADNQSRCAALDFSGVLVSNATIIVPTRTKSWIVRNLCTGAFTLTVKTVAGSGVVVTQGQVAILWCDGTNVTSVSGDAGTLGGIAPTGFFILNAVNAIQKGYREVPLVVADSATITLDMDQANVFRSAPLAGNRIIAVTNAVDGKWMEFTITQDGTGGRTLTWPANFQWTLGAQPTLSTAANASDTVYGRYDGTAGVWRMYANTGFNPGGGGSSVVIAAANQVDVNVFALAGSPAGATTVTFTINTGVTIRASCTSTPALDLRGFAAGSIINIVNRGYILGRGGRGGRGALFTSTNGEANDGFVGNGAADGRTGGAAIVGPGTGITVTVDNSAGFIWGGGGGGGGGGASIDFTGQISEASGGGGGGGNGGGDGGDGARGAISFDFTQHNAGDGAVAGTGPSGVAGAAGAGASVGNAAGGAGGAGGDWGTAGTAGASPTAFFRDFPGGSAGAAGKAVDLNGGAVTISSGSAAPHVKGAVA